MSFDFNAFNTRLEKSLNVFDKKAVEKLCEELIEFLIRSEEKITSKNLENILQALRNKRMFVLMQKVGDHIINTGRQTYKIRRQYAQSLIDLGIYSAALSVLRELKNDTSNDPSSEALRENKEALGLNGRIYKQLYVNATKPVSLQFIELLKLSIQNYLNVYSLHPEQYLWHGINLVALLKRAEADKLKFRGFPNPDDVAKYILEVIDNKLGNKTANAWDFATAMEACVALNRPDDALQWLKKYIDAPYTDAFEVGSTLRQLQEVWQLDTHKGIGKQILPVLRAALLKREGANILLDANDFDKSLTQAAHLKKLEKVLGDDKFKTFEWYLKGKDRCLPVARIGRDRTKGFGTGFLLEGEHLHKDIAKQLVLITNAHVVSDTPELNNNSLTPEEAIVTFEILDSRLKLKIDKVFFSSPINEMDFSILLFDKESQKKLNGKKDITFYNIAKRLPARDGKQRVYIIGHPGGGSLQISLQDNVFLDAKDPFLHYRTPTEGGSSGSPVFNDNWDLIGLHHAGDEEMEKLDGTGNTYPANEGIWMQSIINAIRTKK